MCLICGNILQTIASFRAHVHFHSSKKRKLSEDLYDINEPIFICKLCSVKEITGSKLISHMKTHFENENDEIECIYNECHKTFVSISGLSTHYYRDHSSTKKQKVCESSNKLCNESVAPIYFNEQCFDKTQVCDYQSNPLEDDYKDFLLKFYAEKHVNAANIQYLNENLVEIGEQMKSNCINIVERVLENHHVSNFVKQSAISAIRDAVDLNLFAQPKFKSQNSRIKEFKKSQYYVAPEEIVLCSKQTPSGKNIRLSASYIPIRKTIENIFKVAQREYFNYSKNDFDYMEDYTDGNYFKKNEFFVLHPRALRCEVFIDDCSLTDPLKPGRGKHKTTGVYMRIGNFSRFFGSRKDRLQLVMLVKRNIIKQFGVKKVFYRFLEDLKSLECGWKLRDLNELIFGTVVFFRTDSLGKL